MNISSIQFNFIQPKTQNTVNRPLCMKNELQTDTVSFSGLFRKEKKQEKDIKDLVPKHKGIIYKKVRDENGNVVKKVPVEVDIVKYKYDSATFDFMLDGENVGYVQLRYYPKEVCKRSKYYDSLKNYRREGIKGDRIIVDMVKNKKQDEYGGIGHLSDLLEIAVCNELGIEPNILSYSKKEAAPLHYLRGKRFIPYEKYCKRNELRQRNVKGKNPNDTIKEIIERTPKGEKFNTDELPFAPLMYMPKSVAKELEEEIKEHPIF